MKSCWQRGNVHVERIRDRPQVAASGTRDLGTIPKKAIQGKQKDRYRYTIAQTNDNRIQEQDHEPGEGVLWAELRVAWQVGVRRGGWDAVQARWQRGNYSTGTMN